MTKIYSMSPGFLVNYKMSQDESNLDMKKIFKRLSFEMGGDGETITKDQLDTYIKKAESGSIKVDAPKLKALKQIQKNWDTISQGDDSITYDDMKNFTTLLAATMKGSFTETEIDDSKSSIQDAIFDYLKDYKKLSSKDEIKKSDLSEYLNNLLSENTSEIDSETEVIDILTDMIASYTPVSTVEAEA